MPLGAEYRWVKMANTLIAPLVNKHYQMLLRCICIGTQQLKGINTGVDEEAPIKLFVMGKNIWRDEYEWPLERTEWTKFYLSSSGNAVIDGGGLYPEIKNSDQTSDSFIYDPGNPVPSLGSQYQTYDFCGPHDRSHIQRRPDVLTFTTDVLTEDMEITGPISATIGIIRRERYGFHSYIN